MLSYTCQMTTPIEKHLKKDFMKIHKKVLTIPSKCDIVKMSKDNNHKNKT